MPGRFRLSPKRVIRRGTGQEDPYERPEMDETERERAIREANERRGSYYGEDQARKEVEEANAALEELRRRKRERRDGKRKGLLSRLFGE